MHSRKWNGLDGIIPRWLRPCRFNGTANPRQRKKRKTEMMVLHIDELRMGIVPDFCRRGQAFPQKDSLTVKSLFVLMSWFKKD
jgi:hypothetical protein